MERIYNSITTLFESSTGDLPGLAYICSERGLENPQGAKQSLIPGMRAKRVSRPQFLSCYPSPPPSWCCRARPRSRNQTREAGCVCRRWVTSSLTSYLNILGPSSPGEPNRRSESGKKQKPQQKKKGSYDSESANVIRLAFLDSKRHGPKASLVGMCCEMLLCDFLKGTLPPA